ATTPTRTFRTCFFHSLTAERDTRSAGVRSPASALRSSPRTACIQADPPPLTFYRSATLRTKRRPDQVPSMAQTLLSTRPAWRPTAWTASKPRSVATPDVLLG